MTHNKNIFGVILAGGSGSRLWPLSREMYPKHLLNLAGDNTLFQSTFLRIADLIPAKNIITVTNEMHLTEINIQLEDIIGKQEFDKIKQNMAIGEPVGRNTAPAIGLAALFIKNKLAENNSDPIVFVTPSDHLIKDEKAFLNDVEEGIKLAEDGYIVTFGIKPSKPETGYGYIKTFQDKKLENSGYQVDEFKEKPDFQTAKKYLEAGNYFWNSGIFMFKVSTILQEMQKYAPEVLEGLNRLDFRGGAIEREAYNSIPSISVDYAIMEKSAKIALIPVDCGWNDLGSWEAIYDVMEKDDKNNFIKGNVIAEDSQNCYIYATSGQVSAIGINNTVIIETEDAVLICDKSKTQDVKNIFEKLKKEKNRLFSHHTKINEQWGSYKLLQHSSESQTREIIIKAGHKLVYNPEDKRKRHFYITSGSAKIISTLNEKIYNRLESFEAVADLDCCIENTGKAELTMIEISSSD